MSPFFRRKKTSDEREAQSSVPADLASPGDVTSPVDDSSSVPSAASPDAPQPPAATREELIDAAYRQWHSQLLEKAQAADERDTTVKRGRVDLTTVHPTGSAQFYGYAATRLSSLIREPHALAQAQVQLARLKDDIARAEERHGHAPVLLAYGSVTWTELPDAGEADDADLWANSYDATGALRNDPPHVTTLEIDAADDADARDDSGETGSLEDEPAQSDLADGEREIRRAPEITEPAIFRSVRLQFVGDNDALIQLTDHAEINPVLVRAMRNHGVPTEALADLRQLGAQTRSLDVVVTRLSELGRMYLPGFTYASKAELGQYSRPEHTLLADLEAMEPYIRTSGIMAALAGDAETRALSSAPLPPADDRDRLPEVERGAGDLDVVELGAIEAVASGRSLVLDTPAGSRRVNTVAAVVADAAASGRSVMVVPSRASSASALREELERIGLGELVADFTDIESIPYRLRTGMRLTKQEVDEDALVDVRSQLAEVRDQLEAFVNELHQVDPTWDTSVAHVLDKLAGVTATPDGPRTRVRLSAATVAGLKNGGADEIRSMLREAGKLGAFDERTARSAWAGSIITDPADAAVAMEQVRRLADITIPAAIGQASRTASETGLTQAETLEQWFEQIDVLDGIAESLDTFVPRIFESSPEQMVIATASREWREERGHVMKGSDRRRYRKQALDLVRPGATPKDLHAELELVHDRRETWRRYSHEGGWPRLPDGMAQIRSTRDEISNDIESLSGFLGDEDLITISFDDLQSRLADLIADADMSQLPQRNATLFELRDRGMGAFLADMVERHVKPQKINEEFDLAYTSSVFEQLIASSHVIGRLGPVDLATLLTQFRDLDLAHTQTLPGPVMRAVVNNARSLMLERKTETLKFDELLKTEGVSGLRDLIATYPRLAQAARPVWIVPPSVCADLIPPMPWMDLTIVEVDESAALSESVAAMMRGRQLVVVTDVRRAQLSGSEANVFADVLPVIDLPTHRSDLSDTAVRALIKQGYDAQPAVFPTRPGRESARLVVVDGRGVPSTKGDGAVEAPKAEVDEVIAQILDHVSHRSDQSLAVITVSALHAQRIRDAVNELRAEDLERALSRTDEPLVIADITHSAGLRRDHVIISVGLGKTVHGRVLHSFSQLATPAGLAGLIDALEVPRGDLTIISSLAPGDISTSRVSTPGPQLLAHLLDSVGADLPTRGGDVAPLLADLAARLQNAGLCTCVNVGFSDAATIPLVVGREDIPGTWAVAVVYDDDAYVASTSLRRRDRYRFESLSDRGWDVHQTFSTSLFVDPQGQADVIARRIETIASAAGSDGMPDDAPIVSGRGVRPHVTPGLNLAAYSDDQIVEMSQWISSDGVERTDEELVEAIRYELGLRAGDQIDRVLLNIIRTSAGEDRDGA